MRKIAELFVWHFIFLAFTGCVPFDKIVSHDFSDGYFMLQSPNKKPEYVYIRQVNDSIKVYPAVKNKPDFPDTIKCYATNLSSIKPGHPLYNNTLIKTSFDVDLSTVLLKFRPASEDVPSQLNANLNGIFYGGFRKDFFKLKSSSSPLNEISTSVRHSGFDLGIFAGIGITPVNPTVTMNRIIQEYDGIVFQKGIAVFATYANMSVGLALGFDNLLDKNKNFWIYNQKPWIGLVLGIANF
jgi:hypothetical protein